jgi:hypothetical protein
MSGGTNGYACSTGHTYIGLGMKRGIYLDIRTTAGQADGTVAYPFAHTRAETAQNTITILFLEARLFDPICRRQFLDNRHVRATGKQQFNVKSPALVHRVGVCIDLHPFPYRVVACRDKTGSTSIIHLHSTETAHSGRLEGLMRAQVGNLNPISFSNLEDVLSLFSLDFFTVEFEGDHI